MTREECAQPQQSWDQAPPGHTSPDIAPGRAVPTRKQESLNRASRLLQLPLWNELGHLACANHTSALSPTRQPRPDCCFSLYPKARRHGPAARQNESRAAGSGELLLPPGRGVCVAKTGGPLPWSVWGQPAALQAAITDYADR